MGYITQQWLKGSPERSRTHRPVAVSLTQRVPYDAGWAGLRGVVREISAERGNRDYQSVSFTAEELDRLLPGLALGAGMEARKNIAREALLSLGDAELLEFVASVLSDRAATKRKAESIEAA